MTALYPDQPRYTLVIDGRGSRPPRGNRVVGPDVPFGGFGLSGLGRENGIDAVHEYTQTKASGSSSPAAPATRSP